MEDVRIGRKKWSITRFVDVPTSWVKILSANSKRTHVTIQNTTASSTFVWTNPNDGITTGFHVTRTIPALELEVEEHGQIATADLYAIASGAAQRIVIIETILQDD
jgi:hypothetical protein